MNRTIILAVIVVLSACGPAGSGVQVDEGRVEDEMYTSEEIGWTMEIPKGWRVLTTDVLEGNAERGLEALEEVAGEVDYSGLKYLISFQKNQFNMLQSTSEPFDLVYEGEWADNNQGLKELIYATYVEQGISIDTASSKALIGGLDFDVFHLVMYAPDSTVLLNQEMYSRHINGYDFGVNINYNNDEDRETMMNVWKNSKFK